MLVGRRWSLVFMSFGFLMVPTVAAITEVPRVGHATVAPSMASLTVVSSAENITKFLTGSNGSETKEHQTSEKNNNSEGEFVRCKRRLQISQIGYDFSQPQPTAVARRNARERRRVRMVNLGFTTLRDHVPSGAKNKKLSKVETLRSAIEYIKQLQDLLDGDEFAAVASSSSSAMAVDSASSPSPSLGSDTSSPYHMFSPGEDTYLDFGSWFP
ncbi:achaete-scute homolog 1a-like isoform X2 [Centruroides sculpturatus]|uniref:achaete-scute homolog 1a-like isoform X2 n=1 Tax=Centruroides sculpturatus TaxID=218467 RepID=UPI000C6EB6FF|nr:achaete-scute homolog 1a-like isoform X2 [Centruroides sculpturatus]